MTTTKKTYEVAVRIEVHAEAGKHALVAERAARELHVDVVGCSTTAGVYQYRRVGDAQKLRCLRRTAR